MIEIYLYIENDIKNNIKLLNHVSVQVWDIEAM